MDGIGTRAERQATYDQHAAAIREMVELSDEHEDAYPQCPVRPLCIGRLQAEVGDLITKTDTLRSFFLIIVGVLELSRAGKREAALQQRLAIQRGLTDDAITALASAHERERALEDENQTLLARIDELEQTLGNMTVGP